MQYTGYHKRMRLLALLTAVFIGLGAFACSMEETYGATKTPAQIKNLKLVTAKTGCLQIKWSASKSAAKYQIAYKRAGFKSYRIVTTKEPKYTIPKLKSDTTYCVKVRGLKDKKYGKWSDVKEFKTKVNYKKASDEAKIKISASADKITIKIKSLGLTSKGELYRTAPNKYLADDKISGIVKKNVKGIKVGSFAMNKTKTFTISRYDSNGRDKIYDKFYIVHDGSIVKGPVYVTSFDSQRQDVIPETETKKGVIDELTEESFDIVEDLGGQWTGLNIDMTALILANEDEKGRKIDNSGKTTHTIDVNGKTYYMSQSYIEMLDYRLSRYQEMGVNVVGIVISFVDAEPFNNYPRALKYIDDARWTNGFNTSTDAGRDYFIAGMEYLANRYSTGEHGLLANYVIGNEIDYTYDWYEVVPNKSKNGKKLPDRSTAGRMLRPGEIEARVSLDDFMEEYSRTLRIANTAVKKYADDVTVSVSLSKEWSKGKAEQQNAKPEKSKRYDSYAPRDIMDWLNYYSKRGGDFDWAVTPHNYSIVHGNASAYQTGLTSDKVYITGNPDDTLCITQSNLEVWQLYLNRSINRYKGKARTIHLTENGCSSGGEVGTQSLKMQKEQAAAAAQYYYRAASLPSVKSIIYYKIQDREAEGATSYKLGLLDTNGDKKIAYKVWKYIDTDRSFEISEKYLGYVSFKKNGKEYSKKKGNIKSYYDVMKTVNSSFDWKKHWNKKKMTPMSSKK